MLFAKCKVGGESMKVVIIGAGMAGSALVDELLSLEPSLEIHLFGEERTPPYNRIYLTDLLAGAKLPNQLLLKSLQKFEEEGIKLHLGERVDKIFPESKKFITSRGKTYSYDRLVIATGSLPNVPRISGYEKKGVFLFRTLEDVFGILEVARVSKRAVVIGGGLLGLECAKALRDIGLEVYVVHILNILMEQWLDATASEMLQKKLESFGIKVLLNKKTEEILGEKWVKGVRFADGEVLETDLVVIATGIKPNTGLAQRSGLKVRRGILVNDFLETSVNYIYAVGECIEHRGKTYGTLYPIMEQVKVCAKNLVYGNVERYEGSLDYSVLKVAGVRLMSAGRVHEGKDDQVFLYKDEENYRKAVIKDGKLEGFILYGNLKGSERFMELLRTKGTIDDPFFLIRDLLIEERKEWKPSDIICNCNVVSYGEILKAIQKGAKALEDIQKATKASTSCGSCAVVVEEILRKHVKLKPARINKVEEYKKQKHPFERELLKKLEEWKDWQEIPEDDRDIGLKWYGIFYRKATPGYFMVRIRITHGRLTSEQAKVIAHLSKKFGKNDVDLTSRQQVQLRWIELKNLPEVLMALQTVGLTTLQTGMDNVRNITGDPLSGLVEESVIDTIPIAKNIERLFLGKKQYADLPRKFNLAILGSKVDAINCKYNDLCFYLAQKDGLIGFNVYAGGKIGSGGPVAGFDLDIFVRPHEILDIAKGIFELYSDMGNREDRNKNRLYFLIKELGVNGFRKELEQRLMKNLWRRGEELVQKVGERCGIIRQKNGLYAVSLVVPTGIFTGTDLERVAELAKRYGSGEIRLSTYQNLYIVNVPEENLNGLLNDELFERYRISNSPYFEGLMACQGSRTCAFGVIENKPDAIKLAKYLSERLPREEPIRMHWSGCAKGCGQHGAGDIGFVGTKVKVNGEVKLAVDVFLGGEKVGTVPLDELHVYVERLLKERSVH
jgi:nitrite reductase (NADH) large subunit